MRSKSFVAGKSTAELLGMSYDTFIRLNYTELRQTVNRLASTANKRLATFEKRGVSSPAVWRVQQSGGRFGTRGKDVNALRAEYARVRSFIESKTSTIKGIKKVETETIKKLKAKGIEVTRDKVAELWKAYERIKERNPSVMARTLKYNTLQDVAELLNDNLSLDDIVEKLTNDMTEIYERGANDGFTSVGDFFELPPDF